MNSEEWKKAHMDNILRELRLESQRRNNAGKPPLRSEDVLETGDFTFSPITPGNREGDSGKLLLAKRRADKTERYLVKHEYCDCAANEFVYFKLARGMGLKMPTVRLFHLSDGEKRKVSKTGYTVGIEYLDVQKESPSYELIRERAENWEDFHGFSALYTFFLEDDSFEILLASDNYIYRVDTTSSFIMGEWYLGKVGLDMEISGINIQDLVKQQLDERMKSDFWEHTNLRANLERHMKQYGEESRRGFLRPFYHIQDLSDAYVDDFLNTLCYFYPDFVGDYYRQFIHAAKKKAKEFIRSLD